MVVELTRLLSLRRIWRVAGTSDARRCPSNRVWWGEFDRRLIAPGDRDSRRRFPGRARVPAGGPCRSASGALRNVGRRPRRPRRPRASCKRSISRPRISVKPRPNRISWRRSSMTGPNVGSGKSSLVTFSRSSALSFAPLQRRVRSRKSPRVRACRSIHPSSPCPRRTRPAGPVTSRPSMGGEPSGHHAGASRSGTASMRSWTLITLSCRQACGAQPVTSYSSSGT